MEAPMTTLDSPPSSAPFGRRRRPQLARPAYEVSLEVRGDVSRLSVTGTLNSSAACAIEDLMALAEPLTGTVEIDASRVSSVEPGCLARLLPTSPDRPTSGLAAAVFTAMSASMAEGVAAEELCATPALARLVSAARAD
jgi:hypothetical protein